MKAAAMDFFSCSLAMFTLADLGAMVLITAALLMIPFMCVEALREFFICRRRALARKRFEERFPSPVVQK